MERVASMCQPRGQCACYSPPDTPVVNAVFQFTVVAIHIHSSIALWTVDHGHMRLGYEPNGSTVLTTVSLHTLCTTGAVRCSSVMVIPAHCTGIATAD